jgi:polyhydroxybutyrate depolymerase
MRRFTIMMLVLAALALGGDARRAEAADTQESLTAGGVKRTFYLHVPESVRKDRPDPSSPNGRARLVPLVLVFHGGGGHARRMARFTGFDELADAEGFVVAYPDGLNRHWNDTRGFSPADDAGFVRLLLDHLQSQWPIDPRRVYAAGISNGGFFSNRLACDLSDRIAAIASVAATMPESLVPQCRPSQPVSVMFIHGVNDPLVPIAGGPIAFHRGSATSLSSAARFWRDWDHTVPDPITEDFPDQAHDGTKVRREIYGGGKQETEVVVYTIEGGGHTWPGGSQYLPAFLVGKVSHNLDATRVIWEFFRKHPR